MNRSRLLILVSLLLLIVAAPACSPGGPTISISAPPNGAQVAAGQTVEVQFHAEGSRPISWVQMTVNGDVVAVQEAPLAEGQTPLDGILRWAPPTPGTYNLILTAIDTSEQQSTPTAVSITVAEETANIPTPTLISTSAAPPTSGPTRTPRPGETPASPTPTSRPGTSTPTRRPPTSTPTQRPPAVPPSHTPTATRTNTPLPVPELDFFVSDIYQVDQGQCATLHWKIRNAVNIYLNQVSVANPEGTKTVCYAELSDGVNFFRLVAEGAGGNLSGPEVILEKLAPPPQILYTAPYASHLSGSTSDGGNWSATVYPGDDGANSNYIGFMSFDITGLPSDAIVSSAILKLGNCIENGNPWTDMAGELYITYLYYGDLEASDYHLTGGEYLASIYNCNTVDIDITASVNAHKAPPYYQITLSWPVHSDFDGSVDDVTFYGGSIDILYTLP